MSVLDELKDMHEQGPAPFFCMVLLYVGSVGRKVTL